MQPDTPQDPDQAGPSKQNLENQSPGQASENDLPADAAQPPTLSQAAVGRMSLYYRELHRLIESQVGSVNSQELGKMVNVSPAVVRRDLSALGTIGRRGVGYDVGTLIELIGSALGSGVQWKVVLVGVGSLGDALLRYRGFERLGFRLVAAFDSDPRKIGKELHGVPVFSSDQLQERLEIERPELAILAVPAEYAADVAALLVGCNLHGILNFAPTTLKLPSKVAVVNVDLASELQRLAFTVQTQR